MRGGELMGEREDAREARENSSQLDAFPSGPNVSKEVGNIQWPSMLDLS